MFSFWVNLIEKFGIRTIAPRGKLPPGQGWGLSQSQGQYQGLRATRLLSPRKTALRLGLGVGDNFPRGQMSQNREIYLIKLLHQKQPPEVSPRNILLEIFTRKHLCWSLFLIKLKAFRRFPVFQHALSYEYCKIFRNTYFENHFRTAASDSNFMQTFNANQP